MALTLTERARSALQQVAKEPNIVLEIEGLGTVFGAQIIQQYVRIGGGNPVPEDENLIPNIGDPETDPLAFYIGGFNLVGDQDNLISFDGTSTSIKQTINTDKGEGTSISSLSIALIDDGFMTRLITPGEILDDLLQRRAKVYLGLKDTAWPDDYVVIFRGVVTDINPDAGKVILQLSHPDDKKRSNIYKQVETTLVSGIDNSQTDDIELASVANILTRIQGPDGTYDDSFKSYVRIDDELIEFTGFSGNKLTGVTRGALNTTAAAHDAEAQVTTFYRLQGNGVHLALKLMASGYGGPFIENLKPDGLNVSGDERVENSIFFKETRVNDKFGINVGDYVTLEDSENPANDCQDVQILDIVSTEFGDFVVIDSTLADSDAEGVSISVRSQWDTLPDGLRMHGDEIDVEEHLRWHRLFLSSVEYDFYLKETIENAKEFIEKEIYMPMAAYSLPRKSRASMGYHIGPIPGTDIVTFNESNIKNPSRIKIRRSTNKNFYNEIVYKYDEHPLEEKFLSGFVAISENSKNRIRGPNKTLVIESKGMRQILGGDTVAQIQALRRLNRYQFAAEIITFEAFLQDSFGVEIGDIIIFDGSNLQLPDIKTGQKGMRPRFLEVQNKDFQIKTGDVKFEAVDTSYDGSERFGLISPSSRIKSGISETQFVIERSYQNSRYGENEFRKWQRFKNPRVRVRNGDFSVMAETTIVSAESNTITVSPALPFVPTAGMKMDFVGYSNATETQRLIYAFMKNTDFDDGTKQYVML